MTGGLPLLLLGAAAYLMAVRGGLSLKPIDVPDPFGKGVTFVILLRGHGYRSEYEEKDGKKKKGQRQSGKDLEK